MSLRKKACAACVTSKRRCNQSQPACYRCTKLHLTCQYPSSSAGVGFEALLATPDESVLTGDETFAFPFTFDNFMGSSSWDSEGLGRDFTITPHTTIPMPHLEMRDLGYLGGLTKQFQPADEESAITEYTSILQGNQPAGLTLRGKSERDNFCPSSCQSIGLPQDQVVLADFRSVPMLHDANRWSFCAGKMMSYIATFAKTASTAFITQYNLQSPLTAALGVCAAHETLTGPNRVVLDKLIETEISNLIQRLSKRTTQSAIDPSASDDMENEFTLVNDVHLFREELARVQAMTLYHIMRSFGSHVAQRRQAAEHEPLLAAWTTSLQERMHKLYGTMDPNATNRSPSNFSPSPRPDQSAWMPISGQYSQLDDCALNFGPLREDELESAHRTILISYFVRATYTVVTFGICPLISELESLMVSVPASVRGRRPGFGSGEMYPSRIFPPLDNQALNDSRLPYKEFLKLWEQGFMSTSDLEDEYTQLLLVACKGVEDGQDVISSTAEFRIKCGLLFQSLKSVN
ncbi:hypothetical protein ACQKWADRAFT_331581 [Trichoderma austrokoningii]